jgi:hypothetical protein
LKPIDVGHQTRWQDLTGRFDPRIHEAEMLARVPWVGVLEGGEG